MPGMMDRPPMPPQVQAQMGGPNFGPGVAQAQQQMDKSPAEVAVGTVEKILMGVQDDTFRPYVEKAMATLKVGLAMVQQKGPQSKGMTMPMAGGAPPGPQVPGPPVPGAMAG